VADDLQIDALAVHRLQPHIHIGKWCAVGGAHQVFVVRIGRALVAGGQLNEFGREGVGMDVDGFGGSEGTAPMVAARFPGGDPFGRASGRSGRACRSA